MRILSVKQPWAWLLVNGIRPVENRSSHSAYRGVVLIHASLYAPTKSDLAYAAMRIRQVRSKIPLPPQGGFLRGGIIGAVDMVDCVSAHRSVFFSGPVGFVFKNPRLLPFMPMRGMVGLTNPSEEVRKKVSKLLQLDAKEEGA
jgi:hypothetical protein